MLMNTKWRMGIRDAKDWGKWYWSKEYDTLTELMNASVKYISQHPGVVVKYITVK